MREAERNVLTFVVLEVRAGSELQQQLDDVSAAHERRLVERRHPAHKTINASERPCSLVFTLHKGGE